MFDLLIFLSRDFLEIRNSFQVAKLFPFLSPFLQAESVDLSGRNLEELDDLSICKLLKKISLKSNRLANLDCLQLNLRLTWIDVQGNRLSGYFGSQLKNLTNLSVLNFSHNEVREEVVIL